MEIQQLKIGWLETVRKPALIPYDHSRPIAMLYDETSQGLEQTLSEAMLLQLLRSNTELLFYEVAPTRGYTNLKRLISNGFGVQITNPRTCEATLAALEETLHRRSQLLAAAQVETIEAYNRISRIPEPVLYLFITDPSEMVSGSSSQTSRRYLENICNQGAPVGVIAVLLQATKTDLTKEGEQRLNQFWAAIQTQAFGFDLRRNQRQPLQQPQELWRLFDKFQIQIGMGDTERQDLTEQRLLERQAKAAAETEQDFLSVRIGMNGANPAYFRLGEASHNYHALIGGSTRSGKSTMLNNILLQICENYTPAQIQLWLMDFKDGIEFSFFEGIEHIHELHTDNTDQPNASRILQTYTQLVTDRAKLLKAARVTSISDYNKVSTEPLPRCLLVIDEVQSLFRNRDLNKDAQQMLSEVSKKGAGMGLHLIFSTQSYQNMRIENDVKAQFHLRIALTLATGGDCHALLGSDNEAPLRIPRHTAVYNPNLGHPNANQSIALNALPDFNRRLELLRQRYPVESKVIQDLEDRDTPKKSKSNTVSEFDGLE